MCTCTCALVFVLSCVCVDRSKIWETSFIIFNISFLETRSLTEPGEWLTIKFAGSICLLSLLWVQICTSMPEFYMYDEEPDLSPHPCAVISLTTKLAIQSFECWLYLWSYPVIYVNNSPLKCLVWCETETKCGKYYLTVEWKCMAWLNM